MARITYVKAARETKRSRVCDYHECRQPIEVGQAYKWIKIDRFSPKRSRHADHPNWRPSEMTNSRLATVYAAQEAAHDALDAIDPRAYLDGDPDTARTFDPVEAQALAEAIVSDVEEIVHDVASGAEDCKSEYEESLDAMGDNLRYGPSGEQMQEYVDTLDSYIDEVSYWSYGGSSFDPDEIEPGEPDSDDDDRFTVSGLLDALDVWLSELIDEAREAVDGLEL